MTTHTLTFTTEELEALGLAIAARIHKLGVAPTPELADQRNALEEVATKILNPYTQPE